jgi:capsular polysaccharide biosynthesis protein
LPNSGEIPLQWPWPVNIGPQERHFFAEAQSSHTAAPAMHRLEEVVFNAAGEFYHDGGISPLWYPHGDVNERRDRRDFDRRMRAAATEAVRYSGEHGWITDRFAGNYFHWLCDSLPRLELLFGEFPRGLDLLVPRRAYDQVFVRESLEAWPLVRLVEPPSAGQGGIAQRLVLAGHAAPNNQHDPRLVVRVRKRIVSHFAGDAGRAHRRLYVTRRGARLRRLANEADMTGVLERHGFEIVEAERLSFAEQVRKFAEARIICGPHGAGLANMAFMPPGGAAIEIRPLAGPTNGLYTLAGAAGHAYFVARASFLDHGVHPHAADIAVAADELDAAIRAAIDATA